MRSPLTYYRVMAWIVGVLLAVLFLVGVPLANFDGSGMWHVFPSTPAWVAPGSELQHVGLAITEYLGVAHGWLYMIFLVTAFVLALQERWEPGFTLLILALGTVPLVSFWAEHRATRRVRAEAADGAASPAPTTEG